MSHERDIKPIDHAPRGLFRDRNFVTPNVQGYYKLRQGYAELSSGPGIIDRSKTLWGVTVRPEPTEGPRLSKLCFSLSEAMDYIESLS
jgi:hypothetical protein